MSLFRITISVADRIERLMRQFLWSGADKLQRDCHVNCERVYKRTTYGAQLWVIRSLKISLKLVVMWLRRFPSKLDSYGTVIRNK